MNLAEFCLSWIFQGIAMMKNSCLIIHKKKENKKAHFFFWKAFGNCTKFFQHILHLAGIGYPLCMYSHGMGMAPKTTEAGRNYSNSIKAKYVTAATSKKIPQTPAWSLTVWKTKLLLGITQSVVSTTGVNTVTNAANLTHRYDNN